MKNIVLSLILLSGLQGALKASAEQPKIDLTIEKSANDLGQESGVEEPTENSAQPEEIKNKKMNRIEWTTLFIKSVGMYFLAKEAFERFSLVVSGSARFIRPESMPRSLILKKPSVLEVIGNTVVLAGCLHCLSNEGKTVYRSTATWTKEKDEKEIGWLSYQNQVVLLVVVGCVVNKML